MKFIFLFALLLTLVGCGKTVREARLHQPSPDVKIPTTAAPQTA